MTLAIDIPTTSGKTERNGILRFVIRLFREKPLGAAGGVIFILFLLCGLFADVLAPYGMNQISPRTRLMAPSWAHWFGTDNLGRDLYTRMVHGTGLSLTATLSAVAIALIAGSILGLLSGSGSQLSVAGGEPSRNPAQPPIRRAA